MVDLAVSFQGVTILSCLIWAILLEKITNLVEEQNGMYVCLSNHHLE